MHTILSSFTASVSELKKNPSQLLASSDGEPIAILNHNKPTAYLLPAETYEAMLERLDDIDLAQLIESRKHEKKDAVTVSIDEL